MYDEIMDMIDMRMFHKLYTSRNISEVAKELYLTQPTISYRLNKLRDELDKKLYEYSGGFHFTESGKKLYAFCDSVLREYKRFLKELESKEAFRINMSPAARLHYLDQVYGLFQETATFPLINFTSCDEAISQLINDKIHAAFVGGLKMDLSQKEYLIRELMTEEIILAYHESCPDDISGIPIINDEITSGLYDLNLDYLEQFEGKKIIGEIGNAIDKMSLINRSPGGIFIPRCYAEPRLEQFPGVRISEKYGYERTISLIFKKKNMNNSFIKVLIEEFL